MTPPKKLRILLIDPGSTRSEINEPIGIGALASYIHHHLPGRADAVQYFAQLDGYPHDSELAQSQVVGISTRLGSMAKVEHVLSRIRRLPESHRPLVVLGDLIATFATEHLLREYPGALCVLGEGEDALVGIGQTLLDTSGLPVDVRQAILDRQVPNVAFVHHGAVQTTPRKLVDLSTAPAPERRFAARVAALGGIVRAEGSRGCAWGLCNFCAVQYKYCETIAWRPVPIRRIVDELTDLSDMGVRSPFYTDEDFIGDDPLRAVALAHAIQDARTQGRIAPDLTLYVDARVDSVLTPARNGRPSGRDVFKELKSAGLREVFLGIESGAKEQVRRYKKAATTKKNLVAVETLLGLDLTLDLGFIMFDPEMTIQELRSNVDFIEAAGLKFHDARVMKRLRVEPGTPVATEYSAKGLIAGSLNVDDLTFPYRWKDPLAEAVHAAFSAWEAPYMEKIYEIQATTRGEVPTEELRTERRERLGKLRAIDLDVLNGLVRSAKNGGDPLSENLASFAMQRDILLSQG